MPRVMHEDEASMPCYLQNTPAYIQQEILDVEEWVVHDKEIMENGKIKHEMHPWL